MSLLTSLKVLDHPKTSFKIGDTITREGTPGGKVFILASGAVEVSLQGKVIATLLTPGEIFGEIASVCGCNYGATVTIVQESEFYIIDNFVTYLKDNHDDSIVIIKTLCERIIMMNDNAVSQ